VSVAPTASATLTAEIVRSVVISHIVNYLSALLIANESSRGNEYHKVVGSRSVKLAALAVAAILGYKLVAVFEGEKCVTALVNTEDDIAAVSAVSAVRTAVRNVFLSVKGNCSVAAVSCLYVYSYIIYKHIFTSKFQIF
jgi:hypothetical protein